VIESGRLARRIQHPAKARVVARTGHPLPVARVAGYIPSASSSRKCLYANALQHAFGRIGQGLGAQRRSDLVARIESYWRRADPLSVPVAILAHYASDGELPWLAGQSYLEPFPAALRLRHSVPR
jgi:uncharacterized protein YbgA (DUF1722 family)